MKTLTYYFCDNCDYRHVTQFDIGKCEICNKEVCDECCSVQKSGCFCCNDQECIKSF